jgi:predicted nucleic acid-binding protein
MSVEPGVLDANILVYALDAGAPQHAISRALIEAARDPATALYLTSQVLCEFYSVVTNPRRGDRRHFDFARAAWHTFAVHTCAGSGGLDGLVAAPSSDWRRCVRFAAGGDHASQ